MLDNMEKPKSSEIRHLKYVYTLLYHTFGKKIKIEVLKITLYHIKRHHTTPHRCSIPYIAFINIMHQRITSIILHLLKAFYQRSLTSPSTESPLTKTYDWSSEIGQFNHWRNCTEMPGSYWTHLFSFTLLIPLACWGFTLLQIVKYCLHIYWVKKIQLYFFPFHIHLDRNKWFIKQEKE